MLAVLMALRPAYIKIPDELLGEDLEQFIELAFLVDGVLRSRLLIYLSP